MMSLLAFIVILLLLGGGLWGWPLVAGFIGLSSVTDKSSALKNIMQLMHTYDITTAEIETACHLPATSSLNSTHHKKGNIAKTLFIYLGAIFILAGISTYIATFWNSMGGAMRVLVTLGVGYILLVVLISALHEKKYPKLILPVTLACVFMMSSGWFVFLNEVFPHSNNWRAATLFVFGIMALHQGILFLKYRRTVLAFMTLSFIYGFMSIALDIINIPIGYIAIILGASLFLVGTALEKTPQRILVEPALLIGTIWLNSGLFDRIMISTASNWASLIIGICVMSTAYGLQKVGHYPRLISLGYFIGSIMAYAGLFSLVQNTSVELLYLAVTTSILYFCVLLQSRALLLSTVIAMLSFISYYSSEHFAYSLGWPVTLVILGITFMGIGAIAIKVKQRI